MKVGIITFYYNSINYGGNLQAYALTKYLAKNNVDAEQIPFYQIVDSSKKDGFSIKKLFLKGIGKCKALIKKKKNKPYIKDYRNVIQRRKDSFYEFNQNMIPHNSNIYNSNNIADCVDTYDAFITGSDQVWNLKWYDAAYFLDFVPSIKPKYSYAASFSMEKLTEEQELVVKKHLSDFSAISVREENAIHLLENKTKIPPILVLDPTLLLDKEDWDEVCHERIIDGKYVFAYFLGRNIGTRSLAEKFAKSRNYKLVSIVYASGNFTVENARYGDVQLIDIGPEKFLSLIKYAEYIFTDSFHAVVFSTIYKKDFFVFNRDKNGSMNSRIMSITNLFDLQERFCATEEQETLEYLNSLPKIDYDVDFPKFEKCKMESYEFVKKNIL